MVKFDFRVADLIDRLDWSDPDFPACVRMLDQISHVITVDTGKESVRMHVISIDGEQSSNLGITGGTV